MSKKQDHIVGLYNIDKRNLISYLHHVKRSIEPLMKSPFSHRVKEYAFNLTNAIDEIIELIENDKP